MRTSAYAFANPTKRASGGRHRLGRTPAGSDPTGSGHGGAPDRSRERRELDGPQRVRASRLGLLEPGWLVLYAPYHRRFYALARTSDVADPVVSAATVDGLRARMRQAETSAPCRGRPAGPPLAGWVAGKVMDRPVADGRWRG
ncbi:hypothetical protein Sru01_06720 [Sphaerisporangium rufum]|uniref:Uncharacterized protein n=1 Tax=Sphaerisporangium rufum TaxID=1381558 RepID=A0A919V2W2_9ACTN|nr:hypothetical protein [Sphaerisporangium rufum]GII75690.1 hypothetical protein Sru01_06720 [Sphaerisporangium rufum]